MGVTEKDLRQMLDVVSPHAQQADGPELPNGVLQGLGELIPCAGVVFNVIDMQDTTVIAYQDVGYDPAWRPGTQDRPCHSAAPQHDQELFSRVVAEEGQRDLANVYMWQDYYSRIEFARTLWAAHLWSGPADIRYQLAVRLPPHTHLERRLVLFRTADQGPFSERDRLLLTLLRPHLTHIRDRVEAQRRVIPALTPRQWDMLRLVATGATNRQIARQLGVTENTVRKHLENTYARLGVISRTQAVTAVAPHLNQLTATT